MIYHGVLKRFGLVIVSWLLTISMVYAHGHVDPVVQIRGLYKEFSDDLVKINQTGGSPDDYDKLVEDKVMEYVDLDLLAKGVIGRKHWSKWMAASQDQRDYFMSLFRKIVIRTYANSIKSFKGSGIEFVELRKAVYQQNERVVVRSKVKLNKNTIEVDYKLYWRDAHWRIYDFTFAGISFVRTYQEQLDNLLSKNNFAEFLVKLNNKLQHISQGGDE